MVRVYSLSTNKLDNETAMEFIQRICTIKQDLGLTWKDVAELINEETGYSYSDSWYRKNYNAGAFNVSYESITTTAATTDECAECCEECGALPECLEEWAQELLETESKLAAREQALAQKKVAVSDLVTQNNAYVRRLSREQTIKDIAHDYAQTMSKEKQLHPAIWNGSIIRVSDAEGILLLSDWHYGMVCDNPWNYFDPDVCKYRVNTLLNKVIKLIAQNDLTKIHVLDLADLIAGRIHTQIRIESRFDVITQTMEVAEILAEFLDNLTYYCPVSFYSCLDNHSRLEPNKKESMDLESLARLIPWYLVERLKDNDCVEVHDNKYGADIITCTVAGHNIIGVHGDNDPPARALERLSMMTHEHYDMLCTAHLHHLMAEEQHQSMVVSNGSLMGVDRYAEKLRLTSDPSQTLIVATPDNVCEALYRIVLK